MQYYRYLWVLNTVDKSNVLELEINFGYLADPTLYIIVFFLFTFWTIINFALIKHLENIFFDVILLTIPIQWEYDPDNMVAGM